MAWLVHDGRVLASLERADTLRRRTVGLLGRKSYDGALLIEGTKGVHSIGMKFPIDVAFCDDELRVLRVITMTRHRVSRFEMAAKCVIETEAGRFRHWNVKVGDQLEIRGHLDPLDLTDPVRPTNPAENV